MRSINHLLLLVAILTSTATAARSKAPDPQVALDSLYAVWQDESQTDSTRVNAYSDYIGNGFLTSDPDSAFSLAEALLDFAQQKQYPKAKALAYNVQGESRRVAGRLPEALDYFQRSLKVYEELGNRKGMVRVLSNMALGESKQGNYSQAMEYAERGLKIGESIGDKEGMAKALGAMAETYYDNGDRLSEAEMYQRQLKIYVEIDDKKGQALVLYYIGYAYGSSGDLPSAHAYYQRSLKLYEEIDDRESMGMVSNALGFMYQTQGNYSQAVRCWQRSLRLLGKGGDKRKISTTLRAIGRAYLSQNSYSEAEAYCQRSLKLAEESGDKATIASALLDMGAVYGNKRDYEEAGDYLQRALELKEEEGDKATIANALNSIADNYLKQGNYPQAVDYVQRSIDKYKEIGDSLSIATPLVTLGQTYNKQELYASAIVNCKQGLDIGKETAEIDLQKDACTCLYDAYKGIGNSSMALVYLERSQVLADSLKDGEAAKALQQMEFEKVLLADSLKQQQEKMVVEQAHQQEVAKKNKVRNFLVGGGLVLLALAIGFFSRWRYVRRSRDIISREKDRSENLLLNILPAEIAEELKQKGEAAARDFDLVSILFTDFKGFTQASEKLSATDLVAEINVCFKAFDGIVGKYNIEKIKTIGDAYMCAGGLPVPDKDSVKNTVYAGLEMQAFMTARKTERDAAGLPAFEMRVGIHTGPVVAGIVGVKKFQYDIWGDTVNTASRMESSGEVGQVNISEATYELVKGEADLSFTPRGKVQAKGKGEMEMYFVSRIPT